MRKIICIAIIFIVRTLWADDDGMILRGFADASLQHSNLDKNGNLDETSKFALGGLDFFLTKKLDKKTDALVELVFEQNSEGELVTDLERLYLRYKVDQWLQIGIGRFHTALGYWNETYHHGSYLFDSATRPFMFRFEDDGGILPVHTVGLEFVGNGDLGGANAGYILHIGNGRGLRNDPPQTSSDANKSKSVSLVGYYDLSNRIRLGLTYNTDEAPAGSFTTQAADPLDGNRVIETTTLVDKMKENIYGYHIIYRSPVVDFLGEYLKISHKYEDLTQTQVNITAYYAQVSFHYKKLTPFYRYEINETDLPDVYSGLTETRIINTSGLRYELSDASAFKLQYENINNSRSEYITSASVAWGW